jgi:uncharacterized protein YciI
MIDRLHAVIQEHGAAWDAALALREQAGWPEHASFMDGLVAEGFIVLGGPLADGERVLLAVRAPDEDTVRARLAADPWNQRGLLVTGSVDPWTILLDGRDITSEAVAD